MTLTTRILERAEYGERLAGTDLGTVAALLPDDTRIIAVEDDGVLVGCWSLVPVWQAEGLWMAPAAAQSATVGRRLLRAMRQQAADVGACVVLTGATTEPVRQLLTKVGAQELPVHLYAWPMETVCQQP